MLLTHVGCFVQLFLRPLDVVSIYALRWDVLLGGSTPSDVGFHWLQGYASLLCRFSSVVLSWVLLGFFFMLGSCLALGVCVGLPASKVASL